MKSMKLFSKGQLRPSCLVSRCSSHRDVEFPSFDAYRRDVTKDPASLSRATEDDRKGPGYGIMWGCKS